MKQFISRIGLSLAAVALVVAPMYALGQSPIEASIDSPEDGATVTVNEEITFEGSATGGDEANHSFNWVLGDGDSISGNSVVHTYTETGTFTVTLTASDFDNEGSDSIEITVVDEDTEEDLQISNVQVPSDLVTENSAVIRWTTNVPATSRVIFDTVSHGDISGESEPNFGYAFSTNTTDEDPMVTEHEVTVSGLNPDTEYFFRVVSTR